MAYAFDTLGYARRLREAGVAAGEAEAHAEAARDFIMTELVTKTDLDVTRRGLEAVIENVELRQESRIDALELRQEKRMDGLELRQDKRMDGLEHRLDSLELRLLVRLGGVMAVGVAILAAIIKF